MRGTLLVVAGFLAVCIFYRHQTDERSDERTNATYASNKLKMAIVKSMPESEDHSKQEFLQDGAEDVSDIQDLRDEDHVETRDDVSQLVSYKMKQNQQQSDMSKVRSSRQRRTVQTPETKLVCQDELSCRNRCKKPRTVLYQAKLSCFCDEDCEFFEDCCADYDDFCGTNAQNVTNSTTQTTNTAESLVNQENRDLWSCYEGEDLKGTKGVWMIGSCPSSWPEDEILYLCRNLSQTKKITIDNYYLLFPVYTSNGRVYHNRFCARCNGVPQNYLKLFTLAFDCYFTPPRHMRYGQVYVIPYLFSYCRETSQQKNSVYFAPRKGGPRRYCLNIIPVFNCSSTFNIDVNMTLAQCLSGKPRIVTSKYFYRNIDCAKCDNQMNQISCGPNITTSEYKKDFSLDITSPPKPLSLIFDYNNDEQNRDLKQMQIKSRCPPEKVFDHYLDICSNSKPALPRLSDFLKYQVIMWLQPRISPYEPVEVYQQGIAQALDVPIEQVRSIEIQYYISFTIEIHKYERSYINRTGKEILFFTSSFNITINRVLYTVIKVNKRILSCANRQKYDRSEYTVRQDGSSAVSIKKTGQVLQYTDYYINTTETSTSANDSQAIFICRLPQISNCSGVYILINEGDFRVLMNLTIFVNASKRVYHWSKYIWQDKKVLVCENPTTYFKSKVVSNDDPLLTTITLVCMSLSIIGLVFVLVTYSLFSELRTPPGINLMNLSVSILLAQLLWILGSGQTDTPMACTVIAVILHYLFLVSFMWTSIIAFDTWRAFSTENRAFSASNHEKYLQVLRHMAVGWLPAIAYVGICVVLHLTDTVNIGYNSKIACWIANKWAILYFFAVPVFMLLVFNMVFCVMTFRAIKATTAQARAASDHDTKENVGIYVRIASLMGFTWIFGFAAPFGWQFLWYPFVILNGLQGLYIALACAFNKRARSLYKRLFKGRSPSNEESNTSVPKAKTDDTEYNRGSADAKL